jgi:uncharacterized protein (DUF169 family)
MVKMAQEGDAFYAAKEDHECKAALIPLGLSEANPVFDSGEIGPKLGVYDDLRAKENHYLFRYVEI